MPCISSSFVSPLPQKGELSTRFAETARDRKPRDLFIESERGVDILYVDGAPEKLHNVSSDRVHCSIIDTFVRRSNKAVTSVGSKTAKGYQDFCSIVSYLPCFAHAFGCCAWNNRKLRWSIDKEKNMRYHCLVRQQTRIHAMNDHDQKIKNLNYLVEDRVGSIVERLTEKLKTLIPYRRAAGGIYVSKRSTAV